DAVEPGGGVATGCRRHSPQAPEPGINRGDAGGEHQGGARRGRGVAAGDRPPWEGSGAPSATTGRDRGQAVHRGSAAENVSGGGGAHPSETSARVAEAGRQRRDEGDLRLGGRESTADPGGHGRPGEAAGADKVAVRIAAPAARGGAG